jgi:hypothetical protein
MTELSRARAAGPLAVHVEGFRAVLVPLGYSPWTARDHGYVLAQLSRWLEAEHLSPSQLTDPVLDQFVRARRRKGCRRWRSKRSLRPLVAYLRRVGAIPAAGQLAPDGPLEMLLDDYRRYLAAERPWPRPRCAPAWMSRVVSLRRMSPPEGSIWALWPSPDVTGFLLRQARLRTAVSVKARLPSGAPSWASPLARHVTAAARRCPSLGRKKVTPTRSGTRPLSPLPEPTEARGNGVSADSCLADYLPRRGKPETDRSAPDKGLLLRCVLLAHTCLTCLTRGNRLSPGFLRGHGR